MILTDINDSAGEKIASHNPSKMTYKSANVTSQSAWVDLSQHIKSKHGKLDILVNNAGTSYKNKPTLDVTEEEFDKVFTVNVKSIFWAIKECIPIMERGASVVNIASVSATRPRGGLVWYAASKGAVATVSTV